MKLIRAYEKLYGVSEFASLNCLKTPPKFSTPGRIFRVLSAKGRAPAGRESSHTRKVPINFQENLKVKQVIALYDELCHSCINAHCVLKVTLK